MGRSVVVVDDVAEEARQIARFVQSSPYADDLDVTVLLSPAELEAHLVARKPLDILFMDICLGEDPADPSQNGIDLAARLLAHAGSVQVVYATGFDEFHTRAYDTRHASFVKKPVCQEDVDMALGHAIGRLDEAACEPLLLRRGHATDMVNPRSVVYVESDRRHVVVHSQNDTYRSYGKLADLLEELPPSFARCHQSYVVNLDFVERLGTESATLVTGEEVPVSRRWRQPMREALFAHIRGGR